MQFGLKLGSKNTSYTEDIHFFYKREYFQYIELFATPESFDDTIEYWKQLSIPIIIHAPHSFAGMNLSLSEERENNINKIKETFRFADALGSEFIIFHSGINGTIEEAIYQLRPFIDSRCLIENKPKKGLKDEKCIGSTPEEIKHLLNELQISFCFDIGHAICAANSLEREPIGFMKEFLNLNPSMYHLTDGDYKNEHDTHLHYGKGTFPLKELIKIIPSESKITNEAKHEDNLNAFKSDSIYLMSELYLRKAVYSDIDILYEWATDPETRTNAFNTNPISLDNHKSWFHEKLNSINTLIYIYHKRGKSIGQIRFDIKNDIAIIDYTISPSMRNKGHGYIMMVIAEIKVKYEHPEIKELWGDVKYNNIASQNVFRKLNYKEIQQEEYIQFSKLI